MKEIYRIFLALAMSLLILSGTSCSRHHEFSIGDGCFLLDGKPFVIKSGEMHYPRIPAEYWEQRIQMCKAMGMNTICLYVFWNVHEQRPGEFDFTGNNDVAAFCRLAQKHGMYVIVRPGPYACAEWDMGGLPWWLLQKEDISLRSQDPYFMERVRLFMGKLGEQLADLQLARGGNILMMQVENEFGSYGTDKPYLQEVAAVLRESGFTDVPLFQCDWSSNFRKNALDGLVWTINFGAGSDIERQFKPLKEADPHMPLMCSEYWSGWFDRWGSPHETRSTESLVKGMKDMLDRDISFSLYMAHGGTTWGHWAGANCPPYASWCSSYDYDAPISEAGHTTEKFWALRELLAGYSDEELPEVPEEYPVKAFQATLDEVAPLWSNLPQPLASENVRPMEFFNQGYGSILYRTHLKDGLKKPALLVIDEVHDWAEIFIDGRLIGILDRRHGDKELLLPACRPGSRLDILVENMGRVNYSRTIYDWKGITKSVSLGEKELSGWEVYCLPADYAFAAHKNYEAFATHPVEPGTSSKDERLTEGPAFWRGNLWLDSEPADTYLDTRNLGKGLVWINGHAIGRFWEIGPQQTLYVPGCWLREGNNELIVLDLLGPKNNARLQCLTEPILDELHSEEAIKAGETGNWNRVD